MMVGGASGAFGVAAVQAGEATVHDDDRLGLTFAAEGGFRGEGADSGVLDGFHTHFVFDAMFINQLALVGVRAVFRQQADGAQV